MSTCSKQWGGGDFVHACVLAAGHTGQCDWLGSVTFDSVVLETDTGPCLFTTEQENVMESEGGIAHSHDDASVLYWFALATALGYNELAKLATSLGDKAYFRLLRDETNRRFVEEAGGNKDVFAIEDEVITIQVPYSSMPNIVFRARDVELMRDYVYEHDKKQRTL